MKQYKMTGLNEIQIETLDAPDQLDIGGLQKKSSVTDFDAQMRQITTYNNQGTGSVLIGSLTTTAQNGIINMIERRDSIKSKYSIISICCLLSSASSNQRLMLQIPTQEIASSVNYICKAGTGATAGTITYLIISMTGTQMSFSFNNVGNSQQFNIYGHR